MVEYYYGGLIMTIMDKEEQNTNKRKKQVKKVSQGKDKLKKKVPIWRYRFLSFIMIILTIIMISVVVYNELFNFKQFYLSDKRKK